jgi:type III pantothenate kinase
MILLADIGNTRIKWATHDAHGLSPQRAETHGGWSIHDIHQQIACKIGRPERVIVSNVAGPRLAALLTEATLQAWGLRPVFVHSEAMAAGVRNAYSEPGKLGVDRWLAMIAAHRLEAGMVCVVSVGTAMTIDGLDTDGTHLGGLIVPGPDLMVRSLLGNTSDIAARAGLWEPSDEILATDTASAIHNGARHALAALIGRVIQSIRLKTHRQPSVILTGGASDQVESLLPFACRSVPELVLQGLVIVAVT